MEEEDNCQMPEGFTEQDLLLAKMAKCVQLVGGRALCEVSKKVYAHPSMRTTGGHLSVREWCSQRGINHKFDNVDESLLSVDLMNQEFDISFSYFLLTDICLAIISKMEPQCQAAIDRLRKLRNSVYHVDERITSKDVKANAEEVKTLVTTIYMIVGKTFKHDFKTAIKRVGDELDFICNAKLQAHEDTGKFLKDKISMMIREGRQELQKCYSRLGNLKPLQVLMDSHKKAFQVDKVFTPLKMQDCRSIIAMEELLTITFRRNQVAQVRLFHGLSGCGKTSLVRFMIHAWQNKSTDVKVKGLADYNLVFYIEIQKVKSGDFVKLLKELLLSETCSKFREEDIITTLKELDLLFIIDGYDEKEEVPHNLVTNIFELFPSQPMIITTRPECLSETISACNRYKMSYHKIEVCGFDEERREEFSRKLFAALRKDPEEFLNYLKGTGQVLGAHLNLPLIIALLIILWDKDVDVVNEVTTATCLYQQIFLLCRERAAQRVMSQCTTYPFGLKQLQRALEGILCILQKVAWTMMTEERYCLEKKDLKAVKEVCKREKIEDPDRNVLSSFLVCEDDDDSDMEEYSYSFLHKTQREYFAAGFLSIQFSKTPSVKNILNCRINKEVLIYLTGHMAIQKTLEDHQKQVFQLIDKISEVEKEDFNFWWNFVAESRPVVRVRGVPEKLCYPYLEEQVTKNRLPRVRWSLSESDVVCGIRFLNSTRVTIKELIIEIGKEQEPNAIHTLHHELQLVGEALKRRRHSDIMVELVLYHHELPTCEETSDQILACLEPWARLSRFQGSLRQPFPFCRHRKSLKHLQVTVREVACLTSFQNLPTRVKLHLILPRSSFTLQPLFQLSFMGDLDITLVDADLEGIRRVMTTLLGRTMCRRLCLDLSQLTVKDVHHLLKDTQPGKFSKLTIKSYNIPDEQTMRQLDEQYQLTINWIPVFT